MEIRVALALFVVLCGALGGRALSDGAKRRAEALRVLSEATRRLRVHMTSMFEPVPVALEHADCELFSMVARAMEGGVSAEAAWDRVERKATKRGGSGRHRLMVADGGIDDLGGIDDMKPRASVPGDRAENGRFRHG